MNILFVWTGLTSYMGDCWRALAQQPGVKLKVVVAMNRQLQQGIDFQAADVLRELDYLVVEDNAANYTNVRAFCGDATPDVIFAVGWYAKVCRALLKDEAWQAIPKICCFDMPWRWQLRCLLAPWILRRRLKHYHAAYVPGEACARYAKWLGFRKVAKGLFAIETQRFTPLTAQPPRADYFLYLGRYSPEKRLDVLAKGYQLYRARGGRKELHCYGKGDCVSVLQGLDGVQVHDFVAPAQTPTLYQNAAAFVLASDFDPWPLVLLEAMSAGCPIVASDRCTNYPELGSDWHRFPHGSAQAIAEALLQQDAQPRTVRIADVVKNYDAQTWARRTLTIAQEERISC